MFTFINSIYVKLEQFISGYKTFYWQIFKYVFFVSLSLKLQFF